MTYIPTTVSIQWTPELGWIMTPPAGTPPEDLPDAGFKARRIADMLERFGVNTFSSTAADSNMWGSWPADYSQASVIAALKWLVGGSGLTIQLREYHYADRRVWQEPWCQAVFAATGARFTVAIGAGGGVAHAASMVTMAQTSNAGTGWLRMVEGVNEPNTDFGSGTIPVADVIAAQNVLSAGVAPLTGPHPVLVAGPSIVFGLPFPEGYITPPYASLAQMATIRGFSTIANAHLYPPGQIDQEDGSDRGGTMRDVTTGLGIVYGQPITITEWHPTLYGVHGFNLEPAHDAYYTACFFLSAAREGIDAWYWYALFDYGTSFLSGLFPKSGSSTPRPAANTIRALFTLTGDTGSSKRSFGPASLDYTVTGLPAGPTPTSGGQHALFQASDGTFFLFVWLAQALLEGPTTPVVVTFASPQLRVRDYKVSAAVNPTACLQDLANHGVVNLALNGSVHLLRIDV